MIELKAIRASAEAAKGLPEGDWNYEPHGQTVWNGRTHMVCDIRGWGHLGYLPNGAELQDAMGRHIANLNPATVLALLDRLEAAEKEIQLTRNAALEDAASALEGHQFVQDGIAYRETQHAGSWQEKSTVGLFVTANAKKIRSLKS